MNRNFFVLLVILPLMFIECDFGGASSKKNVVTTPSSDKAITDFSFASPAAAGVIDETLKKISVTVPDATVVTSLVATFTTSGASVKVGYVSSGERFNGE